MGKKVTKASVRSNLGMGWEEVLHGFLFWKQAQGICKTTSRDYERHVTFFFKRFPHYWGTNNLRESVIEYMADHIKPATYNIRLIYLKAFFEYCVKEEYIPDNPLNDFKKLKAEGRIVDIPEDILQRLLSLPNQKTFAGLRDYALYCLPWIQECVPKRH